MLSVDVNEELKYICVVHGHFLRCNKEVYILVRSYSPRVYYKSYSWFEQRSNVKEDVFHFCVLNRVFSSELIPSWLYAASEVCVLRLYFPSVFVFTSLYCM